MHALLSTRLDSTHTLQLLDGQRLRALLFAITLAEAALDSAAKLEAKVAGECVQTTGVACDKNMIACIV